MIGALARKFFGSANDRRVKGYQSRVNAINELEPELAALSDEALKARTAAFRQLVLDAPPPVVARALGYSADHAHRQHTDAGATWARYAASGPDNSR